MFRIILHVMINSSAVYCAARLFPSIELSMPEAAVWAGIVLSMMNLLLRPLLFLLTLPVNLITLGAFTLILNTWMVILTSRLVKGLSIAGFWPALLLVFMIYLFDMLAARLLGRRLCLRRTA